MSSFEFTPNGIRERLPEEEAAGAVVPAAQAVADLKAKVAAVQEAAREHAVRTSSRQPAPLPEPIKRRHFVKELRARLRIVERHIKSLRGLEDEAAEIRRLIAAASAPPAKVTAITARKSG